MVFAILAIISFALQNLSCKEYGRRFPPTLYAQSCMTCVSLVAVVAIMALAGGAQPMTGRGYVLAALFGAVFVITLCTMTLAMNYGHMGLTLLIQNSSMLISTVAGIVLWNEKMTLFKGAGTVCILILLALSALGSGSGGGERQPSDRKKWLVYLSVSFLGNGALSILQTMMSRECESVTSSTFTFWTSLISIGVALLLIGYCALRGQAGGLLPDKRSRSAFGLCCLGIGVGTAGGNTFTIMALTLLDSIILFPLRQGGLVLLMWLLGLVIYREKITRSHLVMLAFGLAGLILLNL